MRKALAITLLLLVVPAARGGEEFVFFVREGDTARSLSANYLVRPTAWERVVQYNYILKPGNLIRVPPELVRKEERAFVDLASGEVAYLPAGGREWLPAVSGLILRPGDRVRTGPDGSAVLRMGREDRAVLRAGSEAAYDSFRGFLVRRANRVKVLEGTVIASTRRQEDREARFIIQTPESELELSGTEIRVRVTPGQGTRFEVLEGEVVIDTPAGKYRVGQESGMLLAR